MLVKLLGFAEYLTVLTADLLCILFSFALRFSGPQRKTWTESPSNGPSGGWACSWGFVGIYKTWPYVGKNYANTWNISDFCGIMYLQHICFYLCVSFSPYASHSASNSSFVRYYSHTISVRHISFDYGFDGSEYMSCRQN